MKLYLIPLVFSLCLFTFALSQVPADRNALLNGEEGTQAKVAETLGYPMPKNVLDHADELKLSEAQRSSIRKIIKETVARAKELAPHIIKIEEELHGALEAGLVNEKSIADDAQQIGRLRGKLRGVFLVAHLKTKNVLTANQLEMYKRFDRTEVKK